jgi:putative membrane protein
MATKQRSAFKGALAGLIGGLAGAGAKIVAEQIFPPRSDRQTPAPLVLAERVAGHPLNAEEKQTALESIHWAFGALAGAIYGAAVEYEPTLGAWKGAAFGITLNKMTHESLLPKMGLSAPTETRPARERVSEWVSHAVYGVVTDAVRRAARKAL